jgi:hypothetical protein
MLKKISYLLAIQAFVPLQKAMAAETELGEVRDFGSYISEVWAWASQLIFGVSIVTLIIGGVVMMFAGDDEKGLTISKGIIQSAIIASLLVVFSAILMNILQNPSAELNGAAELSQTSMVIQRTISTLFALIGGIAIIALIFSGFLMVTSGGDLEKTIKAKKRSKFAIIGLVIALSAYLILNFVIAPFT